MFPNCKTAQEFKCARTKATAITKCLAKLDVEDSANQMKSGPFVIGTDGSQEGGEKHYPIVALYHLESCLKTSPASHRWKVQRAEALVFLGRQQAAQEQANDVLVREPLNADALYVRGLSMYYQDNTEKAFQHFQQVLRLAPDHVKARDAFKRAKRLSAQKEAGNRYFREERLQEAQDLYRQALAIDPLNACTNAKLFFNCAAVNMKLNRLDQAIQDCSEAIERDGNYVKAFLRRGKCYMDTEQYEEATRDYEKVCKLQRSREHKQLWREAKEAMKKSQRKDYYKVLGVNKTATEDEIKKAYKKRALKHHPDRHAHASKEEQKKEEVKFKEVGEAYSVLSDGKRRAQYDSGQSLNDIANGAGGCPDVDAEQIFRAFFSTMNGGIPPFPFGFPGTQAGGPGAFPGCGFGFQYMQGPANS
ncbi:hypothetical protein ACOMHN_042717 [Nucella lapillus]